MGLGGNPAARPAYDRGVRENGFGQPIGAPVADWGGAQPISPVTLTGTHVRLEPLTDAHAEVLYDPLVTETDPRDWTYLFGEPGMDRRQFADYVGRLQRTPASLPMAILSTAGAGLGIAAYLRIDPAMGSAEVGSILYAAALQRTTGATESADPLDENAATSQPPNPDRPGSRDTSHGLCCGRVEWVVQGRRRSVDATC